MNWTLEVIVVPVSDVDRSRDFYEKKLGFIFFSDPDGNEWAVQQDFQPTRPNCPAQSA